MVRILELMKPVSPIRRKGIIYYITPHGFGHAVRSLEIIRELLALDPGLEIVIVSDIPDFLVEQNVGRNLPFRRKRLDIGLVQFDSLRFDLEATRGLLETLRSDQDALVAEEAVFLRGVGAGLVVSDIGFLPFHAAAEIGVQGIGISNFTWDWIYSRYAESDPRWESLVDWIRSGYRKADLCLQLPMHGDCSVFRRVEDVPLVARHARRSRAEVRGTLGFGPEDRLFLIAFAALDLGREAVDRIEAIGDAVFLYKHPLHYRLRNGISLDPYGFSYADVVGAVDGVITKPGYGIVSDCLAHGTPMIYCDRGEFPEYPILVDAIQAHLPSVYLNSDELSAGRWETALRALQAAPHPCRPVRTDGARVCADRILRSLNS